MSKHCRFFVPSQHSFEIYWHFLLVGSVQECISPRAGYWKQNCNSSCLTLASSEDQWTQDKSLPGTFLSETGSASRVPAGWYCGWLQQTGTISHQCQHFTLIKVLLEGGINESGINAGIHVQVSYVKSLLESRTSKDSSCLDHFSSNNPEIMY